MLSSIRDRACETGRILYFPPSMTIGEGLGDALDVFRRHARISGEVALFGCSVDEGGQHSRRLKLRLATLLAELDPLDTGLIYVHRGYQPHYRTPLLQTLLAGLPRLGGVTTLRAQSSEMPAEIDALLKAQLTRFSHVLVVDDQHERLTIGPGGSRGAIVEFALVALDQIEPGRSLATEIPEAARVEVGLSANLEGAP